MAYFKGEKVDDDADIDLEDYPNLRGSYGFEGNFEQDMIREDSNLVVAALSALKGLRVAEFDVERRVLHESLFFFAVYRLEGIDWTYLAGRDQRQYEGLAFFNKHAPEALTEADLATLSKKLQAPAVRFGVSDAAGACGYTFFEKGEVVEAFEALDGKVTKAHSTRREMPAPKEKRKKGFDAADFAEQFLVEQDVFFGISPIDYSWTQQKGRAKLLPEKYSSLTYLYTPAAQGSTASQSSESQAPKAE